MARDSNARPPPSGIIVELWARLSPTFRDAHNRLRRARWQQPIPQPKVDLYKPPRGAIRPVDDPADPEAEAAAREFLGLDDQMPDWEEKIAKRLALELARNQMANRQLHTETLYRAIAQFFILARESGELRKNIISDATGIYSVSERTVETALERWLEKEAFIDSLRIRDEGSDQI